VLVAVAAAAGIVVVWEVFVATRTGQVIEDYAYDGALTGRTRLWTVAEPVLGVVSVSFVVLGTLAAILVALVRRRWLLAVQALVLVGGANLTTQVLKKIVLERPVFDSEMWWTNSLPSGHTTVAASVSVALLLAVPRLARPWVALFGAGYTAATGISTLVGQWHRPSDVVAAVLVVLFWGALACALTTRDAQDPGDRRRRERPALHLPGRARRLRGRCGRCRGRHGCLLRPPPGPSPDRREAPFDGVPQRPGVTTGARRP
jgi:membrane-associated phospholipid phosphatase